MKEFDVLTINTPVVRAIQKDESLALVRGMPDIYYKMFDITEFIGEELASIRGVKSAHYFPVCFGNYERVFSRGGNNKKEKNIKVGSYSFMKDAYKYLYGSHEYVPNSWDLWLEKCADDKNRSLFVNEHLEMYALDTFMGQCDRLQNTIYEVRPSGRVHLGPLFDYQASLTLGNNGRVPDYITMFYKFSTINDYHKLMVKYPQFKKMLSTYYDVDLVEVINHMCLIRGFNPTGLDLDKYKRFNEASHKKLELILK